MEARRFAERIQENFGQAAVESVSETIDPFILVPAERIVEICRFLREDPETYLDGLSNLSGVDWPEEGRIEVVYHLFSYRHGHLCILKVTLPREAPQVASVEGIWKAADWFEREAYDLLGIRFTGHPNLRRLLMPEDWEGYPLRKDYEEKASYHGIETTREDPLKVLEPAPWGPAPEKPAAADKPAPPKPAREEGPEGKPPTKDEA